ncbi:hypothetical protein CgunFtcFv8_014113 [Champsocephalus gunnari]|uniref:Uncharacterized protein n=1 Tax=Champsocephalus gunnari TaxID=52237 RepID=A0AAN8E2Q2_CHAGU|nr:hypothetical protein CgunFtcFv8_014113 [Champsocephalus gunnari]
MAGPAAVETKVTTSAMLTVLQSEVGATHLHGLIPPWLRSEVRSRSQTRTSGRPGMLNSLRSSLPSPCLDAPIHAGSQFNQPIQ